MLGLAALAGHATRSCSTAPYGSPSRAFRPGPDPLSARLATRSAFSAETMVLVYASFSQRKRIGARERRRLHWATYGIFAVAATRRARRREPTRPAAGRSSSLQPRSARWHSRQWRFLVPPARGRPRRSVPRRDAPERHRRGRRRPTCRRDIRCRDEALVRHSPAWRSWSCSWRLGHLAQLRAAPPDLRHAGSRGRLSPRSLVTQDNAGTASIPAATNHDGDDGSPAGLDGDD